MTDAVAVVLRFAHILLGVMWLGAILFANFVLFPRLEKMQPPSRRDFFLTYTLPIYKYGEMAAAGTIVFGVLLYSYMFGIGAWVRGSTHSYLFVAALVLALVVWLLGLVVFFPKMKRARALLEAQTAPGPPPPEFQRIMASLPPISMLGMILLLTAFGIMIVAVTGFY
ncbi:MAG TPA: hypothetical protein VM681_01710 [Candidatus Thermoplasmatota archaeon]|nr:hypothetical protein [Candidatus Thermoplasmatota archaeon]